MLTELCAELNNYFDRDLPKFRGEVKVENGLVVTPQGFGEAVQNGQYFRLIGSVFNDGVYKWTGEAIEGLTDETFHGAIWLMAVPKEVVKLADDIKEWLTKYGAQSVSPFSSENLSATGYSYTRATISADGTGGSSWQASFARQLKRWRKTRP